MKTKSRSVEDEVRELTAPTIARRLVAHAEWPRRHRHFFVIDDRKPVPFPTHWRRKNISGVTFPRAEVAKAEQWVSRASEDGPQYAEELRKRGIEP